MSKNSVILRDSLATIPVTIKLKFWILYPTLLEEINMYFVIIMKNILIHLFIYQKLRIRI